MGGDVDKAEVRGHCCCWDVDETLTRAGSRDKTFLGGHSACTAVAAAAAALMSVVMH